jgi:two-component system, NtrC family, response regulator HydG
MDEREISRHWKEILNTINDGLVIIGPEGTVRMVNGALEELTGYSKQDIVGQPCSIFNCDVCEVARREVSGKWCLLFDLGQTTKKRCLIARKDGSYAPVLKKASLLKDKQGNVLGAVETFTDLSEIDKRDQRIEELTRLFETESGFHGIVGRSAVIQKVFLILEKAAHSDAPVIIYGASGTGKELVARAIHEIGRRRDGPFIQLNCAALNEALLESELFGHVKGAFTGAYRHRQGRFEAAHGGDIFLDEIGDIPLSIQVKLLRVLETKQFERVGDHRPVSVDVRIVAATHRDINELVAEKKFREDLFFRINVIPIYLPPLRERMEDLPLLAAHFIVQLRLRSGKDISGLAPEAMKLFMSHHWPGNVRELRSALEYAFVIAEKGLIEPDHLPLQLLGEVQKCVLRAVSADGDKASRAAVVQALHRSQGNVSQAARLLGVSRVTLWNRMKKYGIDLKRVIEDQSSNSSSDSGTIT